jgi:hypothetical protein
VLPASAVSSRIDGRYHPLVVIRLVEGGAPIGIVAQARFGLFNGFVRVADQLKTGSVGCGDPAGGEGPLRVASGIMPLHTPS